MTPDKIAGKKLYASYTHHTADVHGPGSEHRRRNSTTSRIRRASKRRGRNVMTRLERDEQ